MVRLGARWVRPWLPSTRCWVRLFARRMGRGCWTRRSARRLRGRFRRGRAVPRWIVAASPGAAGPAELGRPPPLEKESGEESGAAGRPRARLPARQPEAPTGARAPERDRGQPSAPRVSTHLGTPHRATRAGWAARALRLPAPGRGCISANPRPARLEHSRPRPCAQRRSPGRDEMRRERRARRRRSRSRDATRGPGTTVPDGGRFGRLRSLGDAATAVHSGPTRRPLPRARGTPPPTRPGPTPSRLQHSARAWRARVGWRREGRRAAGGALPRTLPSRLGCRPRPPGFCGSSVSWRRGSRLGSPPAPWAPSPAPPRELLRRPRSLEQRESATALASPAVGRRKIEPEARRAPDPAGVVRTLRDLVRPSENGPTLSRLGRSRAQSVKLRHNTRALSSPRDCSKSTCAPSVPVGSGLLFTQLSRMDEPVKDPIRHTSLPPLRSLSSRTTPPCRLLPDLLYSSPRSPASPPRKAPTPISFEELPETPPSRA